MNNIHLKDLTLENVHQWPMLVKVATVILAFLIILSFGYWFLIKEKITNNHDLQSQEQDLRAKFELMHKQAVNLPKYKEQMQTMQKKFRLMLQQLPAKNEMSGLLEDISHSGLVSGLKFELFAPQKEKIYNFYATLPIKIKVVGDYHQIAIFLSKVAQLKRIVTMHDFELQRANSDLVLSMTANIYRYRADDEDKV